MWIGGCSTVALARRFKTPLFVYDEAHLRARCSEARAVFGEGVAYATKAFLCTAMARLAVEEGMHLDVASGGEMHVALQAGVPGGKLVLHGNNKSLEELREAMTARVHRIVVDSFDELDRIEAAGRSFRDSVRDAYLALARSERRVEVVSARGSMEEVHGRIRARLAARFPAVFPHAEMTEPGRLG